MSTRRAFSLVELLVVLGIIAILVAILLPSLQGAQAQARLTVCQANLRSIGQLLGIYAAENDGRVPRGPSHAGHPDPLLAPDVATSHLWTGTGFAGVSWPEYLRDPQAPRRCQVPPQYVGLGLLTRSAGRAGNEVFYCPASNEIDVDQAGQNIGRPGVDGVGTYLFRQLDLTDRGLFLDGRMDHLYGTLDPAVPPCARGRGVGGGQGNEGGYYRDPDDLNSLYFLNVPIEAMALDANYSGPVQARTNHGGLRVNVLFRDASVQGYVNHPQAIRTTTGVVAVPWSTVRTLSTGMVQQALVELDRVLGTADIAFRDPRPWNFSPR